MKTFKYLFAYSCVIFALSSCQSACNIIGTYSLKNNPNHIILKSDSTFKYSYIVGGFEDKSSTGRWTQINKNTIVLNSDIKTTKIPLSVNVIATKNKRGKVNVKVFVPGNDEKTYRCVPFVDDILVPNFNPDRGSYSFDFYVPIHEIYFKIYKEPMVIERFGSYREYNVLSTEQKKLSLKEGDEVCIAINLNDSLFSYRVFNNTEIKFRGSKLIFKDSEDNSKTKKLYLNK